MRVICSIVSDSVFSLCVEFYVVNYQCQFYISLSSAIAVGSVAQRLGRWSLAGGLSLIYACSLHVTTSWVRCPLWVSQPGQLSLPSLRGW